MKNKRVILSIFLFIMLFPISVYSKEYCTITKGTGNDIGDQIKCGTENFYVINSDSNQISLLAIYNLLVGDNIDYIAVNDNPTMNNSEEARSYCMNLATNNGYNPYYVYPMGENTGTYPSIILNGCRVYEKIEYEHVLQDERAVGTKLVDGKSVLPLYGITYMNQEWGYDAIHNHIVHYNEYDENGDLELNNSSFSDYITGYKTELERQGIEVTSVSFITLSKTLDLLKAISGKEIEVNLEYDSTTNDPYNNPYSISGKMDITKYLGNDYKWIYDITYWLGSGFNGELETGQEMQNEYQEMHNDYYISNEGMLCAIGRGECVSLPYPIGNGVRPLVMIDKSALKYNITTVTDGNGTIEVVNSAYGGEQIKFRVTSKKGYKLDKIIVTTDANEVVEFTEGDINNDSDDIVSIDNNVFKMPYNNVVIEAKWTKMSIIENPKTGDRILIISSIMALSIGIGLYMYKKKKFKLY